MGRVQRNWEGWCSVLEPQQWGAVTDQGLKDGEAERTRTQGQRYTGTGCLQGLWPLGEGHGRPMATLREGAWEVSARAPFSTCPLPSPPPAPPSQEPEGEGDH